MSRHRDVRKLDYDEEYDQAYDDHVYGHSMEDSEYGMSPGMEQYLYSRSRENSHGFGLYFPTGADIKEEEEGVDGPAGKDENRSRHGSASSYERPPLSPEDEARLASVLDELRNILGDKYSEGELIQTVITHKFNLESSLNALLNKASPSSTTSCTSPPFLPNNKSTSIVGNCSAVSAASNTELTPQPQRENRRRQRGNNTSPSKDLRQLSLNKNIPDPSPKPPASQVVSHAPAVPVVIAPAAQGSVGGPKVIRGFEVLDTEEVSTGPENSHAATPVEQEAKRSRSSTPVLSGGRERAEREAGGGSGSGSVSTPLAKPPPKIRDKAVDVLCEYEQHRGRSKTLLNLVVVGHVDAGKSTLMGHLLYLKGNVAQRTMHKYEQESRKLGKQSFMYAWVLDDTDEERSRGVTVDVAQRMFETSNKCITLLDAPGHRDFIPNMITGAARADVAVLVVDASTGAFEAGFESGGQTREHALLVRSLGVSQLVVAINKLDAAEWSEERMKEVRHALRQFLKSVGYKDVDVTYVPCSGLTGENLTEPAKEDKLAHWYKGPTLLQAIDQMKVPERGVEKPVRMCICDVYKGQGSSMCVSGRLDTGYLQANDRLLLLPQGDVVTVKGVQTDSDTSSSGLGTAFAGDHVTLTLSGVDPSVLHTGDFLCDPGQPIPLATRVQARIVVFTIEVPIIKGAQLDFHYQSVTEPAKVRKLVSQLHKTSGQILKARPRALTKNSAAMVELEFFRPLCLELFRDYKEMGRFMLRTGGKTVAAGLVTQILV